MTKETKRLSPVQKKVAAGAGLFVFVIFFFLLGWFVGRPLVRFFSEPEAFRAWVDEHGAWGRLAYVGLVFFQVIVAVIPGEPLEIGGGYAFGTFQGTLYCFLGASLGSLVVFALVRWIGVRVVEIFFSLEKIRSLRFLRKSAGRNFLFLTVFMLPGTPKDLLSYFAGLTDIGWIPWLFISSFGRLPSIVSSTLGGSALGEKNYVAAAVVFAVTFCFSGAGFFVYRQILKRQAKKRSAVSRTDAEKQE